jgi:hypothetical protein
LLFPVVYQLKKESRKDSTLARISRKLRYLNRHCDLRARTLRQ